MYETLDGDGLATETGRRTRAQGAGVERAAQRRALAFWAVRRRRGVLLAMSYGRKAKAEAVPLRCKQPRLPAKEGMQMNRARAEEYRSLHEASYEAASVWDVGASGLKWAVWGDEGVEGLEAMLHNGRVCDARVSFSDVS